MLSTCSRRAALLLTTIAAVGTWAGTAGATVTSVPRRVPLPPGQRAGQLDNVSCASDRFCVGVGTSTSGHGWTGLIERWTGARWTPMAAADDGTPATTELLGVDCRSSSDCVAVGYANTRHGSASVIERWNGSYWSQMPHPDPKRQPQSELGAVSCPSASWCMAVGSSGYPNGQSNALVERWNGSRWSIMRIHHWAGASDTQLLGVACPTRHACHVVGVTYGGEAAVIQDWNGHTWTPRIPGDDDYSGLGGVFCVSAANCLAAGGLADSSGNSTYLEHYNGHAWNLVDAGSWNEGQLYGVGCSRRIRLCVAVGDNVEIWTGGRAWSYHSLANWTLEGVSCAKRMCMAVGQSDDNREKPVAMLIRDR